MLNKGITPNAQALSVCRTTDNTNAWCFLAGNDACTPVFQYLLNKDITPSAEALSVVRTTENTNAWFYLAASDARISVFQELLNKGITPNTQALSVCRANNKNIWWLLASNNTGLPVFQDLLNKEITPNADDLSLCCTDNNTNAWCSLSGNDVWIPVFQDLLNKGIIPTAQALSEVRTTDNTNAWFYLASSDARIPVFQNLLNKGITPNAQALLVCGTDNQNIWWLLASSGARLPVFQDLLNKDIVPDTHALSACNISDNKNTWQLLNVRKSLAGLIFKRLKNMQQLENDYNLKPKDQITALLSRDDLSTFYGFLYLFYLDTKRKTPMLPAVLWLLVGDRLLPNPISRALISDENRSSFVKHHMIESLAAYRPHSFFSAPQKDRTLSLKEAIKKGPNPVATITNQLYMSLRQNTPYSPSSTLKYQQPFNKVDKNFDSLLREGYFLSKP